MHKEVLLLYIHAKFTDNIPVNDMTGHTAKVNMHSNMYIKFNSACKIIYLQSEICLIFTYKQMPLLTVQAIMTNIRRTPSTHIENVLSALDLR